MQTTNLNPRNFKPGTVIVTTFETFTVDKILTSSIHAVTEFEGKIETTTIPFSMFTNRLFLAKLVSVTEPVEDYSPEYVEFKGIEDMSNLEVF